MQRILLMFTLLLPLATAAAERAPAIELMTADGDKVSLPRHHDGVDVYLFWATWCPYCKALMPHLESIRLEYGESVTIFALNIREDGDPQEFLTDYGLGFVLLPEADPAAEPYGVRGTPGLFLVDGDGNIRFSLYDIARDDPPGFEELGHRARAARRAPHWAAEIRRALDGVLADSSK